MRHEYQAPVLADLGLQLSRAQPACNLPRASHRNVCLLKAPPKVPWSLWSNIIHAEVREVPLDVLGRLCIPWNFDDHRHHPMAHLFLSSVDPSNLAQLRLNIGRESERLANHVGGLAGTRHGRTVYKEALDSHAFNLFDMLLQLGSLLQAIHRQARVLVTVFQPLLLRLHWVQLPALQLGVDSCLHDIVLTLCVSHQQHKHDSEWIFQRQTVLISK
mmetsp:Transcript_16784/g.40204  ORF Transcript_16784/g.40204 Transcript_16784/m.40204 type:complete len:216 (+) Transcript_16784:398-1045(+)